MGSNHGHPQRRAPQPQPELREPRLTDPSLRELSMRDYRAIFLRSLRETLDDHGPSLAGAMAYYAFLAIPALLLVAVAIFGLIADAATVATVIDKLSGVVPNETRTLLRDALARVIEQREGTGLLVTIGGTVFALWSLTGAMETLVWALNTAYEREETRGFVKRRLTALAMVVFMVLAFTLAFGLLVLGPHLSGWVGSAVDAETVVRWVWWTAQWPVLIAGLLGAFATILFLGPNVDHPRWSFITPGTVVAVLIWLLTSGLFALYASRFGSYDKTWGSLAGVIVFLTWLWLSSLSLLFGAEINAEAERSRELRSGQPAQTELQAPTKG